MIDPNVGQALRPSRNSRLTYRTSQEVHASVKPSGHLPAAADPDNGQGCELSTFLLIDLLSIRDEGLTPRLLSKSEAQINQPEAV